MPFHGAMIYATLMILGILFGITQSLEKEDNRIQLLGKVGDITSSNLSKRNTQFYSWVFGSWTTCSQQCGNGFQLRAVSCIEKETGKVVNPHLCPQNAIPARNQTCHLKSCHTSSTDEFKWIEGHWGECSVECGVGEQAKIMYCIKTNATGHSSYTTDDLCSQYVGTKPVLLRACNGESDNCPYWATGSWSECSVTCGFGKQTSSIYCQRDPVDSLKDPIILDDSQCPTNNKPQQVQTCSLQPCVDGSNRMSAYEQSDPSKHVVNCKTSRFGCCQNNITPARGTSYFGCPDQVNAQVSDPCRLPHDSGPCNNHVVKWYFNSKEQNCVRFWYGGCEGNENRFDNSDSCKARCLKTENKKETNQHLPTSCVQSTYGCCSDGTSYAQGPNGEGCPFSNSEICQQAKDSGTCNKYTTQWHFETTTQTCRQFWYGGCGGNSNRFSTSEECESKCGWSKDKVKTKPNETVIGCTRSQYGCCPDQRTPARGPNYAGCHKRCQDSTYGCCADGKTAAEGPDQEGCYVSSGDIPCSKTVYGCCDDELTAASGPFKRGCEKRTGSEDTLTSVTKSTVNSLPTDKCNAPASDQQCSEYLIKWRFDNLKQECVRFWWGGCRNNENIFETQADCQTECKSSGIKDKVDKVKPSVPDTNQEKPKTDKGQTTKEEKCTAAVEQGHCKDYVIRWRFNSESQACVRHWWGGCRDNGNTFESQEDCEAQCMNAVVINLGNEDADFVNICDMPKDAGSCTDNLLRHYYDPRDKTCKVFYYGGCEGNENNFLRMEDCQRECMQWDVRPGSVSTTVAPAYVEDRFTPGVTVERSDDPAVVCLMETVSGHCLAHFYRWSYDHKTGTCNQFIYGGCGGNSNNFESMEQCNNFCNSKEVCHQPKKVGPCRAGFRRFFYDPQTASCQSFTYGGCQGNLNNFATIEDCNRKCVQHVTTDHREKVLDREVLVDVCQLNLEKGNCRGYTIMWYFSTKEKQCLRFVYTGCDGNGNQFANEKDCTDRCVKESVDSVSQVVTRRPEDAVYPVQPERGLEPSVIIAKPGVDAFLKCNLRDNEISWYRDGLLLSPSPRFQIYNNGTLAIRRITEDMSGVYTCRISVGNNIPQLEKFKVEVHVPLAIQSGPTLISIKPGDTAFLHCQTIGTPQPQIFWKRNGKDVTSTHHHSVFGNGTLIINNVHLHDAGDYECTADNRVSPTVRKRITLHIKETISADIQSHQGKYTEGDTISLVCKGYGHPTPQLEWIKEGITLKTEGKVTVSNGDLTITRAAIEDAGMYKCIASNGKDKVEDVTAVQIQYQNLLTKCEDSIGRTKCKLIVTGNLCGLRIFATTCCQSCRKARFF